MLFHCAKITSVSVKVSSKLCGATGQLLAAGARPLVDVCSSMVF